MIEKLKARWWGFEHDLGESIYYHKLQYGWGKRQTVTAVFFYFWWPAYYAVMRRYCEIRDHKYVSDDWATPDSGGMGAHCNRCGWSFHTTLY